MHFRQVARKLRRPCRARPVHVHQRRQHSLCVASPSAFFPPALSYSLPLSFPGISLRNVHRFSRTSSAFPNAQKHSQRRNSQIVARGWSDLMLIIIWWHWLMRMKTFYFTNTRRPKTISTTNTFFSSHQQSVLQSNTDCWCDEKKVFAMNTQQEPTLKFQQRFAWRLHQVGKGREPIETRL